VNYLSVCSGVEAATVAWHPLGWKPLAFSEIEKFPSEVLAHHYPATPNLGDMTKYKEWNFGTDRLDLLVGGTPCQSFSVAGLRKGLDDPRGNLALVYCGILDKFRPKWFVWENVPGVLSSGGGRDFGSFLGAVAELGYGFSYRVLDAQYFGVAQRRRRVFVIGHLGDQRDTAKVLFESDCLRRDIKKSRGAKQKATDHVAQSVGALCARDYKGIGNQYVSEGKCIVEEKPIYVPEVANCLQTTCDDYSRADGFNMIAFENSRRDGVRLYGDKTNTLQAFAGTGGGNGPCVAIQGNLIGRDKGGPNGVGVSENEPMYTLTKTDIHAVAYSFDSLASNSMKSSNPLSGCREVDLSKTIDTTYPCPSKNQGGIGIMQDMAVRRLTPVECERLQGFPDNYTNIKDKCPDGPRYKAMGNSMAVPVMQWIGKRIQMVEDGLL
jgi:DNA (cytosine-5)-methyltransferase 1